ncbi:hypothetical protein [Marinomonas sp. FW-1]|uniref:hypothetical protein n=1 Tax=Marinomonas sp. FW-1 TaxID=2071621 RepID=UPI0010BFBB4B|nr:hypothetical protein [Marinomonas sp. FW-1]
MSKSITKGIYSDFFVFLLSTLIGFAALPLYLNYLSIKEIGIFFSVQAIVSVFSLADIGLSMFLTKKLSSDSSFYSEKINILLSSSQIYQYALGAVLLIIGIVLSPHVASILDVGDEFSRKVEILFLFSWCSVVCSVIFGLNHAIMRSRQHLMFMNYCIFIILLFTTILNVLILNFNFSFEWMGLSLLLSTLIVNIFITTKVYSIYKKFIFKTSAFDWEIVREGWSYVKKFQILRIAQVSKTSMFTVLLSNYSGQTVVAQYNSSNKLLGLVPGFVSKLVMNFFPRFSSYLESNNLEQLREQFEPVFKYGVFLTVFSSFFIWFVNPSFIILWVGENLMIDRRVFILMVLIMAVLLVGSFTGLIIQASGKFKLMPHIAIAEVGLFYVLSYICYQFFGLFGFFLGFLVSILLSVIYSLFLIGEILEFNVFVWIKDSFDKLVLTTLFLLGLGEALEILIDSNFLYISTFSLVSLPFFIYISNQYIPFKKLIKSKGA